MSNYTVMIPSHRLALVDKVRNAMYPIVPVHVDGTEAKCFSWLVNKCIQECPTEIVIICADKAYPSAAQVELMVKRIEAGYGLVAMYRFAFFGFKKELIRKIGWFDERFVKGCWEDNDISLRLREADIAYYESQEVPYQSMPCSWNTWSEAERHYHAKWHCVQYTGYREFQRQLDEEKYPYFIGAPVSTFFMPWKSSSIGCGFYIKLEDFVTTTVSFFGRIHSQIDTLDATPEFAINNFNGKNSASENTTAQDIFNFIQQERLIQKGQVFCDIGASRGTLTALFQKAGYAAYAMDGSPFGLENSYLDVPYYTYVVVDFTKTDLTQFPSLHKQFELVTCFEMLEHIPTDKVDMVLKNIQYISKSMLCSVHVGQDGSPNHINIQTLEWWFNKLQPYIASVVEEVFLPVAGWVWSKFLVVKFL